MNLTIDPWIPVVRETGEPTLVSLREAFARGHEIRDLAVRPHERIALMRLLICIAQAALDGPDDFDAWKGCRPRIAPGALDYLDRWKAAFELFGDGQRFLQVRDLKKAGKEEAEDEGSSVSKLDLALATGNNSTLFDNAGGSSRDWDPPCIARNLLATMCFSPCGLIGDAEWNGKNTGRNSKHSPCIAGSMLHAIIRGNGFLETLHMNLLTKSQVDKMLGPNCWGRPLWERMPASPSDPGAVYNACQTYLGRLVPLSRGVLLDEKLATMTFANGIEYAPYEAFREVSATIVTRQRKGVPSRGVLPASLNKSVWRELHALTVRSAAQATNGGPASLENLPEDRGFDLWVGGAIPNEKGGAVVEVVESVLHVPAAMLADPAQHVYKKGVDHAQRRADQLQDALSLFRLALETNEDGMGGYQKRLMKLKGQDKERLRGLFSAAISQYWTDIEQHVGDLLAVAKNPAPLGASGAWHATPWGKAVWRAALVAYDRACPHETARQIRAYALGRRKLVEKSHQEAEA